MTVAPGITRPDWERELKACCRSLAIATGLWLRTRHIRRSPMPGIETIVSGAGQIEVCSQGARRALRPANTFAPTFISTGIGICRRRPMRPAFRATALNSRNLSRSQRQSLCP
jgi:hypothetical protein